MGPWSYNTVVSVGPFLLRGARGYMSSRQCRGCRCILYSINIKNMSSLLVSAATGLCN